MGQSKDNFKLNLAFGQEGEKEVTFLLLKKGYSILPLYQFTDDISPKILKGDLSFVSPDLTIFKNGKTTFIEAKRKTGWVKYKETIETGCDFRLYEHYKKVSSETGIELWMVFVHENEKPNGIYAINIKEEGRYWDGKTPQGKSVHKPMFFWNFNKMKQIDL